MACKNLVYQCLEPSFGRIAARGRDPSQEATIDLPAKLFKYRLLTVEIIQKMANRHPDGFRQIG